MTTYFVVDNASGSGNGLSEANAFTTIDAAMNIMASAGAGPHKVWVKAHSSSSYVERATIDTVATATTAIVFEGYTSSIGDKGQVTLDGSGSTDVGFSAGSENYYYIFKYFTVNNSTGSGWNMLNGDRMRFIYCQANNCTGSGFNVDRGCHFYKCIAHTNTIHGFQSDQIIPYLFCKAYNNTADGFNANKGIFYGCISYGNASDQFVSTGSGDIPAMFLNCTTDGENADSGNLIRDQNEQSVIVNCILYDAGAATIGAQYNADYGGLATIAHNLVNSNGGGNYSNSQASLEGDVTSAPGFTDEAGADYSLGSSSPAIDAGTDAADIP